jgi:hypothetical protein
MAQVTSTIATAYQHQFREVKRQAAEAVKTLDGSATTPKTVKATKTATAGTGSGKKRGEFYFMEK